MKLFPSLTVCWLISSIRCRQTSVHSFSFFFFPFKSCFSRSCTNNHTTIFRNFPQRTKFFRVFASHFLWLWINEQEFWQVQWSARVLGKLDAPEQVTSQKEGLDIQGGAALSTATGYSTGFTWSWCGHCAFLLQPVTFFLHNISRGSLSNWESRARQL